MNATIDFTNFPPPIWRKIRMEKRQTIDVATFIELY